MSHLINFDKDKDCLFIRLEGTVSARDCSILAANMNEISPEERKRLLVNAREFVSTNGDLGKGFAEKVRMDDCRIGIVNGFPFTRSSRKELLSLFSGDYNVAFFEQEDEALNWLKKEN